MKPPPSPTPSRWYTPWRGAARAQAAPADPADAADWGTAFGLEMSLGPADVAAPAEAAAAPSPGWRQRWAAWRAPRGSAGPSPAAD